MLFEGCNTEDDSAFDRLLPPWVRTKSSIHFTPVTVARYAARMLAPNGGTKILDVGAGPGKFCIVAASEVPTGTFVGIEVRPHLSRFAKRMAQRLSIPNVQFLRGDAVDLDWSHFDAFYFYNPFGEQIHESAFILDRTIDLDPSKFAHYVRVVRERLHAARVGTRVVTYHGFGASPPHGYQLFDSHEIGSDRLELWVKTRERTIEDALFEEGA